MYLSYIYLIIFPYVKVKPWWDTASVAHLSWVPICPFGCVALVRVADADRYCRPIEPSVIGSSKWQQPIIQMCECVVIYLVNRLGLSSERNRYIKVLSLTLALFLYHYSTERMSKSLLRRRQKVSSTSKSTLLIQFQWLCICSEWWWWFSHCK